ncbi:MAG: hypothetical protein MI920_22895 [Kiloniellales bacterium]|nr:hypothetical protein [Kiloniellales bacterium]
MLHRLQTEFSRFLHGQTCAGIRSTAPLEIKDSDLRILSMVSHRDLLMYLVAVKSFYREVGEGRMVVVDDGSLTAEDHALLEQQLGGPEVYRLPDIDVGHCPRGGCWERLLTVVRLTREHYVIQLDSDTLTKGPVPEVIEAVKTNRSFALGTRMGQKVIPVAEASALVEDIESDHVQVVAERHFRDLRDSENLRYIRGSAGFSGFARGGTTVAWVEDLSRQMQDRIGAKWTEWGSEQAMSNLVVANSPDARVLPYPRYANYDLDMDPEAAVFLHFIGSFRYDRGVYRQESRRVVERQGRAA